MGRWDMINRVIPFLIIFKLTMSIAIAKPDREYVRLSKREVKNIVISFLEENIPWDGNRVRISYRGPREDILLPKGDIKYDISARPSNLLGKVSLTIRFYVDGRLERRIWAKAYVRVLDKVVITTRPLGMHQIVGKDDIKLISADLTKIPIDAARDPAEVLGKRTKRPIDANVPLRMGLLEPLPLVKRGNIVLIVAESKYLRVTTLGKIEEEGQKGQIVKVVNISSGKEIYAKVIDSRTVKVDF